MTDPALLDRLVSLTRDLVVIPSTEHRPEDRARCLTLCRNHLDTLQGIQIREFESRGFGSLVATPDGIDHPEVLMVGHLDVIDHPDHSVYQTNIRDGRIWGPGTGDMKGQCAIMLGLFRHLQHRHPGLSLGLAFTSDEEHGGEDGVRYLLDHAGLRCGLAIVPDGGSMNEVTVEEKGILQLHLRSEGRASHAARPWLVDNALLDLSRAITAICADFQTLHDPALALDDHWYPTCSPTILRTANETINCIPAEAEAFLDIRYPPSHHADDLVDRVLAAAGDRVHVRVARSAGPSHLRPDPLYFQVTEHITGHPVRQVKASGGSDARYFALHGIPSILSRPLVGNLHGEDEWIDIDSMGLYFQILERYILARLGIENTGRTLPF